MSSPRRVRVIGAGGHAKVVIATLRAAGYDVDGIFDDDPSKLGEAVLGVSVLGTVSDAVRGDPLPVVIALGDNSTRKRVADQLTDQLRSPWLTVAHPSVELDPSVQLGPGTVVFAGAIIQPDTVIGAHGIVNTGATIDHDCLLGDYVHIAPGVHLAGGVRLSEGVFLGVGTSAVPGVSVEGWTRVGAGAAIVDDLPGGVVAFGIPARPKEEP